MSDVAEAGQTQGRAPEDTVSLKLRFKERLRARLDQAAMRNEASLNSEIIRRLEDSFTQEDVMGTHGLGRLVRAFASAIEQIGAQTGASWLEDWETFAAVRMQMVRAIAAASPPHPKPFELGAAIEAEEAAKANYDSALAAYEELVPLPQPSAFDPVGRPNALLSIVHPGGTRPGLGGILQTALEGAQEPSPIEKFIEENPDKVQLVTERLNAVVEAGRALTAARQVLDEMKAPLEDARKRGVALAQRLLSAADDDL